MAKPKQVAWAAVLDAPDRTEADRKLDPRPQAGGDARVPRREAGAKVEELGGGTGYTSELLARAVAPTARSTCRTIRAGWAS